MNLELTAADRAFEAELQAFIDNHWLLDKRRLAPADAAGPTEGGWSPAERQWFDALIERGWSVPSWPVDLGGTGWTATQHYLWDRETCRADCPEMSAFGTRMLAPVLYTWGSDEQRAEFLPPIREARVRWCQGYSEPGAGSDLASLRTRAVRDGDHFVVNGAKTWTSDAHLADWMFALVRTDTQVKPQLGISFLLIDMKSPGIDVKPILILGGQHSLNSVTFTDVRVPVSQLVGQENHGWTYAKGLLTHERTGIAGVARSQVRLERLKRLISAPDGSEAGDSEPESRDRTGWDDGFLRRIREVEIELMALEITELRTLATVEEGGAPGPESSLLKIRGTEIEQRISDLLVESLGYYALPYPDELLVDNEGPVGPDDAVDTLREMLFGRAASIYGGSNEIQKNIIAKAVLGI